MTSVLPSESLNVHLGALLSTVSPSTPWDPKQKRIRLYWERPNGLTKYMGSLDRVIDGGARIIVRTNSDVITYYSANRKVLKMGLSAEEGGHVFFVVSNSQTKRPKKMTFHNLCPEVVFPYD